MTAQCPQGHTSETDDFCDVCGEPIDAAPVATPAPSAPAAPTNSLTIDPPAAAPPQPCPNCGDENPHDALFCESCGYDFTTGQLPAAPSDPPSAPSVPSVPKTAWIAELWVDPDWFASQEVAGSCATSGAPTIIPLRTNKALIGRNSRSRDVNPQIDCSADGSVSHTHAELTLDHERWFIEDLGSTNGTYIGMPGDPLPTAPIPARARQELADGARVYLGAWCRIQIRKASAGEV